MHGFLGSIIHNLPDSLGGSIHKKGALKARYALS